MYYINCPVCEKTDATEIVFLKKQPLSNLSFSRDRSDAVEAKSFDLSICMCNCCSHVYNRLASVKDIEYKQEGNTTYYSSKKWQEYTVQLASEFINRYQITDCNILEIGSGDNLFLAQFYNAKNYCIGYEPSSSQIEKSKYPFEIVSDYFNPHKHFNKKYDLIVLRHVLEHFESAKIFLSSLSKALIENNSNAKLFLEVPNVEPTINEYRTNDFVYEHISYFSFYSFKYLLTSLNFKIIDIYSTFNNENIVAICTIDNQYSENVKLLLKSAKGFNSNIASLKRDYKNIVTVNKSICIWGAGGRGSSFLNIIKNELNGDEFIVDSDKRKHNKYVPIVGLKIIDYEQLANTYIDCLVITTSLGRDNILLEAKNNNIKIKSTYIVTSNGLKEFNLNEENNI